MRGIHSVRQAVRAGEGGGRGGGGRSRVGGGRAREE